MQGTKPGFSAALAAIANAMLCKAAIFTLNFVELEHCVAAVTSSPV